MKHLAKTKLIWLAVALVPLLVAAGCGAENHPSTSREVQTPPNLQGTSQDKEQTPQLYVVISADTCRQFRTIKSYEMGFACIDVPKSQELIIVETNNPIYQLYIPFEACRIAYCYEISRFFRNLLADEPTLTRAEALQRCLEDEFCGGAIEVVSTTNLFR